MLVDMASRIQSDVRLFSLDTVATAPRNLSVPGSRLGALCDPLRGPVPGRHGRRALGPREGPVQLLPGRAPGVLRDPQSRAIAPPAPVTRCLGHRATQGSKPRDARHHRGGRARCGVLDARACLGQVQPARELDRRRGLAYIRANDVPYNELHERGFVSISCEPCTRAVLPYQQEREGRWWWEDAADKECGLHKGERRLSAGAESLRITLAGQARFL